MKLFKVYALALAAASMTLVGCGSSDKAQEENTDATDTIEQLQETAEGLQETADGLEASDIEETTTVEETTANNEIDDLLAEYEAAVKAQVKANKSGNAMEIATATANSAKVAKKLTDARGQMTAAQIAKMAEIAAEATK